MDFLLNVMSFIIGMMIWFVFNHYVVRWHYGTPITFLTAVIAEMWVFISITKAILEGILGLIGAVLFFIIKAILIIIGILAAIFVIYYIYLLISKKVDINLINSKVSLEKVKNYFKTNATENNEGTDIVVDENIQDEKESTIFCPSCGSIQVSSKKFCSKCGVKLKEVN